MELTEADLVSIMEPETSKPDELDLEPVRTFMEDYVGQVIVNISGHTDLKDIGDSTRATIVMSVALEGEDIKFKLSKLNGSSGGQLVFSPTKYGMFTEKLAEEELEINSVYRISFYG